jgi:hypothetical protein
VAAQRWVLRTIGMAASPRAAQRAAPERPEAPMMCMRGFGMKQKKEGSVIF